MFSGIGGFELGIKQAGVDMECIGYSEVDVYANSIYSRWFPEHKGYGDATEIDPKKLPNFDFLVGGFPCQAFSIAGHRKGFNDTRGTLFFEIARVLEEKKPRYFLLENDKGLLSHDRGNTFKTMLRILSDLGYDVKWEVLNSKWFVPQNRERIFLKGYFRAECGGEILSQKRIGEEVISGVKDTKLVRIKNNAQGQRVYSVDGIASTLSGNGGGQGGKTGLYKVGNVNPSGRGMNGNVYSEDGISPTLTINKGEGLKIRTCTKKGYDEANVHDGVRLDHPNRTTGRGAIQKGKTGSISTSCDWGTIEEDYRIRRLTPTECERLQGFPDGWTRYGKNDEVISDTQRYKCLGNAVTTYVVEYIIKGMFS